MHKLTRGIMIAGLSALVMVLVLAGTAHAQNWNSTVDTGLTSLTWMLEGDTYTWTLTNNSSLANDPYSNFDIVVWDLIPYRIQEPVSWTAPEGWTWGGDRMEISSNSGKYVTPYALAPGQSISFAYRIKPGGKTINASGPANAGPIFGAHVGAVIPYSGALDASDRWEEYVDRDLGQTWHDRVRTAERTITPVPEPSGMLAFGCGALGLTALFVRRYRQHRV